MLAQSTETLFAQAVRENWTSEKDWLWLASKVEKEAQLIVCLQNAFKLNPENESTFQQLRALRHVPGSKKSNGTLRKFINSTKQFIF